MKWLSYTGRFQKLQPITATQRNEGINLVLSQGELRAQSKADIVTKWCFSGLQLLHNLKVSFLSGLWCLDVKGD
jgi:hypothetical protein